MSERETQLADSCSYWLEGVLLVNIYIDSVTFHLLVLAANYFNCSHGCLKGVFAKNERGYRHNAIKKRF